MAIFMGVLPGVFLRPMEPAVNQVIQRVTAGQQPGQARTAPKSEVRGPKSEVRSPRSETALRVADGERQAATR
jgi:hypothetical protein